MLQLNIIKQGDTISNNIFKENSIGEKDPLYNSLVDFINNPNYIRKGINESIRTYELAIAFNNITGNHITHKNKLPQLMSRIMVEHPEFLITKKVRNYGTIYIGIGLSTNPPSKVRRPPMTDKEKNDRRAIRNRKVLDTIQETICRNTGWTIMQYQQMVNLGLICIIRDDTVPNIEAIIAIIIGRLTQYVASKIQKIKRFERHAKLVKADFDRCTQLDLQLMENGSPIYTNRLMAATRTFDIGIKLEMTINNYVNVVKNLPQLQYIKYPDIQNMYELAKWLKENSMYKTRLDMKVVQTNYDGDIPEGVDWVIEDTLYNYGETYTRITK